MTMPDNYCSPEGTDDDAPDMSSMEKTHLLLANKGLTKLLHVLPPEPCSFTSLDCSKNDFKQIDNLSRLEKCTEVIASYNKLSNFTSFTAIRRSLKFLDVSHNVITDSSHVGGLINLHRLDASYNSIAGLPVMSKMVNLAYLDLSFNKLSSLISLRGLCKLPKLNYLSLKNNLISNLRNAENFLPLKVKHLDLSGNSIADLNEAHSLSCLNELNTLVWFGNPCVPSDRKFDYRSFLLLCCSQTLKIVDDKELSELEILKGELLLTRGKLRRFKDNQSLCRYLAEECPLDASVADKESNAEFEQKMKKVIAKRREHLNAVNQEAYNDRSNSSLPPSPFAQWTHQDPNRTSVSETLTSKAFPSQKENCPPERNSSNESADSMLSGTTVILSTSHDATSCLIPEIRSEEGTNIRRSVSSPLISARRSGSKSKTHSSRQSNVSSPQNNGRSGSTITPKKKDPQHRIAIANKALFVTSNCRLRKKAFRKKVPTFFSKSGRESAAVFKLKAGCKPWRKNAGSQVVSLEQRLQACEKRCERLEEDVIELSKHKEQLSQINEELTHIIEGMNEKFVAFETNMKKQWKNLIHFAIPVPTDLKYERRSSTEILLRWKPSSLIQPTGYGFTVNDDFIGKCSISGCQTVISDLLPDKEATIKVQCYVDDIGGEHSLPLFVPPFSESTGSLSEGEESTD